MRGPAGSVCPHREFHGIYLRVVFVEAGIAWVAAMDVFNMRQPRRCDVAAVGVSTSNR